MPRNDGRTVLPETSERHVLSRGSFLKLALAAGTVSA
jgi:hypothetical protein